MKKVASFIVFILLMSTAICYAAKREQKDVYQTTHDSLNCNANLQMGNADIDANTPLHIINQQGGTSEYSIKRTNISNSASVNLAFGFTAENVFIYSSNSNDQEIAIDWLGGTAAAPAANTAGDFLLPIGGHMTKTNFSTTSISLIAAGAGNQTVYVNAWR